MNSRSSIKKLTLFSLFVALELVLGFTPLGLIAIPPVAITLLHIPVIICAITMGPIQGMLLGGIFGVISLIKAVGQAYSPIDLLFNPAASGQPLASLIMCFVPRILLGLVAALVFRALRDRFKGTTWPIAISALTATLIHTAGVMLCLFLFFKAIPFISIFGTLISFNFLLEAAAAIFVGIPVCRALLGYMKQHR